MKKKRRWKVSSSFMYMFMYMFTFYIPQIMKEMHQRGHTFSPRGQMQFLIGTVEIIVIQREAR